MTAGCWSSGFSLGRLAVVVVEGYAHAVAIGLLPRPERRLKPELQRNAGTGIPARPSPRPLQTVQPPVFRSDENFRAAVAVEIDQDRLADASAQ